MADLDVSVPCIRCWRPSAPHGEHHTELRGMGGRGDKAPPAAHETVPVCRDCHRDLHLKLWTFEPPKDGWVVGTNADGTTFERPLVLDNASPSPARWEDAKLGEQWEMADAKRLKTRATIANIYRQRWGWGKGWAKRAADAMGGGSQGTGQQISERSVRRAANIWAEWNGDWELMKALGSVTVAYAIADAEDSGAARQIAEKELALGKKAGDIVRQIEGKSDNVGQTCEEHEWRCHRCGAVKGD